MHRMVHIPTTQRTRKGEPAWAVATLFPGQGEWVDSDYLALNRLTNHLVELSNGRIEVLGMPTRSHQRLVLQLRDRLVRHLDDAGVGGEVLVAPHPVRLAPGKYREPDVLYVPPRYADQTDDNFTDHVEVVMEVLSDDRAHDLVKKRGEYARAGIPEYWIVDPERREVLVLALSGRTYRVFSRARDGQIARSKRLAGFSIDASALFESAGLRAR